MGRAMRCEYERRVRRRALGRVVAEIQLLLTKVLLLLTTTREVTIRGGGHTNFQYEFTTPDRGHGESPVNKKPRGEEEKEIGIDELSSK